MALDLAPLIEELELPELRLSQARRARVLVHSETGDPIWMLISRGFFLTLTGLSFWERSRVCTSSALSASMVPLRSSPAAERASQTHSDIYTG